MKTDRQPDRVRSLPETAAVAGVSIATLRRLIAGGKGPKVTQLSARRIGIRESHLAQWLDARARDAGPQAA